MHTQWFALLVAAVGAFTRPARQMPAFPRRQQKATSTPVSMAAGPLKVGIVGATGAVGAELIGVLEVRGFDCGATGPTLWGSAGGKTVETEKWGALTTEPFSVAATAGFDVVFLAASGSFAEKHAFAIAEGLNKGGVVVDNSSALRYTEGVPLVVPEVNGDQCAGASVIANPNCTTAIALMALFPLFAAFGLRRVIMSTYQAASGAGAAGMAELREGVRIAASDEAYVDKMGRFAEKTPPTDAFAHPLAFNVIPHIDVFQENGYTKEEMKVTWETRKILGFEPIPSDADDFSDGGPPRVSCTAVRIPTLRAHSEAITIETVKPVTPEAARAALQGFPGLKVADDTANSVYPMPITSTGAYDVEVGRIRRNDVFGENGLDLFVCGDQLLRGAALNAVLIAEKATA